VLSLNEGVPMKIRLKAFLYHLSASAVIALLVIGLVFFAWYPPPLHIATGVMTIFLLLLAVDVILGPLLTFLVFKPGKKSLAFDSSVIILLQLSALAYGVYTVAEGRPAWLVFSVDRFELVRVNEIDNRNLANTLPEYQKPAWFGPQWVAAVAPFHSEANSNLLFEALFTGVDIAQRPELYQSLSAQKENVQQRSQPLSKLELFNSTDRIEAVFEKYPKANSWLPLKAVNQDMVVLLDDVTVEVVAVVDLRPWSW